MKAPSRPLMLLDTAASSPPWYPSRCLAANSRARCFQARRVLILGFCCIRFEEHSIVLKVEVANRFIEMIVIAYLIGGRESFPEYSGHSVDGVEIVGVEQSQQLLDSVPMTAWMQLDKL